MSVQRFTMQKSANPFFLDLDRTNLGNARLQGLPEDILGGDASGRLFDWINSAFFFSYVSGLWSLSLHSEDFV